MNFWRDRDINCREYMVQVASEADEAGQVTGYSKEGYQAPQLDKCSGGQRRRGQVFMSNQIRRTNLVTQPAISRPVNHSGLSCHTCHWEVKARLVRYKDDDRPWPTKPT